MRKWMLQEGQFWPGRSEVPFSIQWFVLSTEYPIGDVLKADRFMRSDCGNEVWAGKYRCSHWTMDSISWYDNELVHQESEWSLVIDHHQGVTPRAL